MNSLAQPWQSIIPHVYPYAYPKVQAVSFINADEGWVIASRWFQKIIFDLLHTSNGGSEFTKVYTFPEDAIPGGPHIFQMVDSLCGYLGIPDSPYLNFYKTVDGGYTWNDITHTEFMITYGPYNEHGGFYFLNCDTGFFGADRSIYRTIDGGRPLGENDHGYLVSIQRRIYG